MLIKKEKKKEKNSKQISIAAFSYTLEVDGELILKDVPHEANTPILTHVIICT